MGLCDMFIKMGKYCQVLYGIDNNYKKENNIIIENR